MPGQQEKNRPRDPVTGVILGAEPFDMGEGPHAVLCLHGWSSTPRELRFLALRMAEAGFRCRAPLLSGHGTRMEALIPTRFPNFLAEALRAFDELAARHARVSIFGLSMGGLLALELAVLRPAANLILVAPFLSPPGSTFGIPDRWLVGRVPLPAILAKSAGGPIMDPVAAREHIAYHAMPTRSMVSLVLAGRRFPPKAAQVNCPTLIFHSIHDATSDFASSKMLIEKLGTNDKTLVAYNTGNHILTVDFPRESLEATALEWLARRR